MSIPYYSVCLFCKTHYASVVDTCVKCGTDEGLYEEPFEVKDY